MTFRPRQAAAFALRWVVMRTVTNDQVIGFRLRSHGLMERSDESATASAVGRCGLQDSPPGSALLALHARVHGVGPDTLDGALAARTLLRSWCMRGAPFVVPTADAAVFTTGVLPTTDAAIRDFIQGVGPALDDLGMSADGAVAATGAATARVLAGRRLAIDALGAEVAAEIAPGLTAAQRAVWEAEGPHATGQPVGEAVVHFCVRILTLQGIVCFAPREGNSAPFALVDEWLDCPIPPLAPEDARAELVRRYLHSYGPSKRGDFATWLGVRAGDAAAWWEPVTPELEQVDADGRHAWVLADDVEALRDAAEPAGTRLLPPRDPYTSLRDRDTIVEHSRHRDIWRTVGEPGTILVDGRIAGIWRPRKQGQRLTVTLTPFAPLSKRTRAALTSEAEAIGVLRGAGTVDVVLDS